MIRQRYQQCFGTARTNHERIPTDADDSSPQVELEELTRESSSSRERSGNTQFASLAESSSTWKSIRNWTLFYSIFLLLLILLSHSATTVAMTMQWLASLMASMLFCTFVKSPPSRSHIPSIYAFGLSLLLISRPMKTTFYSGSFHLLKPCRTLQNMIHDLQSSSKLPNGTSYYNRRRPLQAMGLGNGYVQDLADAMVIHFDRYARNETERFDYVEQLNLIGNLFNDQGVGYLAKALEHPYAYTETLLLGRNQNLGDETAIRMAKLIESAPRKQQGGVEKKNSTTQQYPAIPTGQNLTWLELGGTSITAYGLEKLYKATGTRPFSYLGLEYTDKRFFQRSPFRPMNPISSSIPRLHTATYLQELDLTGNRLGNQDMTMLSENLLQTNVTTLGLINNRIGPEGVARLLPLLTQLQSLELGINWRIGDKGAIVLAKALKNPNTTIESLSLFHCGVGQRGADAFLDIFPENKKLKHLSLTLNDGTINQETLEAIKQATTANWKS